MDPITELFNKIPSAGRAREEEIRAAQREALAFDFFSKRDATAEKLEALGKKIYTRVAQRVELYNPIPLFFDTITGAIDTELEFSEVYGGRVYNWAYGTSRRESTLTKTTWTVKQSPRSMHFRPLVRQLQTGRLTVDELITAAAQAILVHKIKLAYDVMMAAFPIGGAYTTNCSSADITQTALDAAIRRVRGVSEPRAIVGSHRALFPIDKWTGYEGIASISGYPDSVKEEIHNRGMIGHYRGIPVIRFKDYRDYRYNYNPIPNDETFIVPAADMTRYNVFSQLGSDQPESPEPHQNDATISFYWQFEDGAAVNSLASKKQAFHRFADCAVE